MPVVDVNNFKLELRAAGVNPTVYQVLHLVGVELSCFCYSEELSIVGNCRVCLVEVVGLPKLQISCALPWSSGLKIITNSRRIKRALEGVLEFLLVNHPLDCPICDQGGECDLQDLSLYIGSDKGRFYEYSKRSVISKRSGPFIKTILTRCIHCTRCVRFFKEVLLEDNFLLFGRGEDSEITFTNNLINPLSGNVIDLCPVGALTAKPYAFSARPWELESFESFDILDSVGSSIRVDVVGMEVMRVVPALNKDINDEWISNKVRFFFDLLHYQRLRFPFLSLISGQYLVLSWKNAINVFFCKLGWCLLNNKAVKVYFGLWVDLDCVRLVKEFICELGFYGFECFYKLGIDTDLRSLFLLQLRLGWLKCVTFLGFLFIDLRLQLPLLFSRVSKVIKGVSLYLSRGVGNNNKVIISSFYNYRVIVIRGLFYLLFLLNGFFLKKKISLFSSDFGVKAIFKANLLFCYKEGVIVDGVSFYYTILPFIGQLQYVEVFGVVNLVREAFNFFSWIIGDIRWRAAVSKTFFVFQGSNFLIKNRDGGLFLPSKFMLECEGLYISLLGRFFKSLRVLQFGGEVKSDISICRGLRVVNKNLLGTGFFGGFLVSSYIGVCLLGFIYTNCLFILSMSFNWKLILNFNFVHYLVLNYYKYDSLYKVSKNLCKAAVAMEAGVSVFN